MLNKDCPTTYSDRLRTNWENGRGERILTSDPWPRNGSRCSNLLTLLVRCCVVVHFCLEFGGIGPTFGPNMLFPKIEFLLFLLKRDLHQLNGLLKKACGLHVGDIFCQSSVLLELWMCKSRIVGRPALSLLSNK